MDESEYTACDVCCAITLVTCVEHHLVWHQTLTNVPIVEHQEST